jgi:hypothetical protein
MALGPADEGLHDPDPEPRWQENYFVIGWDEDRAAGLYLHLQRIPARGVVEVKAAVTIAGEVVSERVTHAADDCFALPRLRIAVPEPFRHWAITYDGHGRAGGPDGWLATGGGDISFGFDMELHSTLAPTDWSVAAARLGSPEILTAHYEVAATWRGELRAGGRVTDAAGLLVRDHSWGPRDFSKFDLAWWTPMVFDGATAFVTGTAVLRKGTWTGFALVDEGDGARVVPEHWVVVHGFPEVGGYSGATILSPGPDGPPDRFEFEARTHFPARYPDFGADHVMNDAVGAARWGRRRGFGVLELNRH